MSKKEQNSENPQTGNSSLGIVISSETPTWGNILEHYADYNSGREITPVELDFYEWVKEKYLPPIKK